jgi:hypothetical protein
MVLKNLSPLFSRLNYSRRMCYQKFATLPDDGLTLSDFIPNGNSSTSMNVTTMATIEKRTKDGRLRLPEWLKRDVVAGENDVILKFCFY